MVDSKSNIWFGAIDGFYLITDFEKGIIKKNPFQISKIENVHVRAICEDRNGSLWVGYANGLLRIDPNTGQWIELKHNDNDPESITNNSIHNILEDAHGNIWIGTWGGISMLSHLPRKFKHVKHIPFTNSLSNNIVSSFEETGEGIWIGTEGGGLNLLNLKTNTFNAFNLVSPYESISNRIKCLEIDENENLWIGTWGKGVFKKEKGSTRFVKYLEDQNVFCMNYDGNGTLWIGTLNGLYKLNVKNGNYSIYSPENLSGLKDYFITALFRDKKGNIWVGTKEGGLSLYNPPKDNFITFFHVNNEVGGIIDNYIICINQDEKGNLWVGTNNGLCRYNYENVSFEDYSLKMNLPDNVINGIVPNNNFLWISTNKGISKYDIFKNNLRNYDLRDGLQSNEFNRGSYFKRNNGEILFGGINGYSAFSPGEVIDNTTVPKILFIDFKIFSNSVKPGQKDSPLKKHISETDKITLNYKQSFFTFDFVALTYLMPEKNRYKYKLEGYNNDWVDLGNERKVSFMNLADGDYTLKIIASNNDEIWNTEGISIDITILPPPWKTFWAYLIYLALIGLLIWFLQQLISSRIKQRNEIINERKEKERNEELNQLKLYFFTNITHEFRTPLTLISAPLDNLVSDDVSKEKKEFYYRVIKENVRRLKRLVDQLLDFRKSEHERLLLKIRVLDLGDFIHRMTDNFMELARKKNIALTVDFVRNTDSDCCFDPEILDKILYNLLSNALKFTPDNGSVKLRVEIKEGIAEFIVSDSGIGISPEDLPHIFERFYISANSINKYNTGTGIGLSFSKRLAEIHHGTLTVDSVLSKGTEFKLSIPVSKNYYSENEIIGEMISAEIDEISDPHYNDSEETDIFYSDDEAEGKKIILIVEDSEDMANYLKTQFSGTYKIYTAVNGKEGFSLAREKMPDIIISDVMMSEMDGFELCKRIKSDILTNHIPFVLLTALSSIENKLSGIELGADAYIEKPFEFKYLDSVVHNLLKQRALLRDKYFVETRTLSKSSEPSMEAKFLLKFEEVVLKHISDPEFTVVTLGNELNLSRSQLFRKFRAITGNNPSDFIRITRLKKAAEIILNQNIGVNELAYEVGFTSPSHFITSFRKFFGTTPKQYIASKKGNPNF